jgi:hypothetical protein
MRLNVSEMMQIWAISFDLPGPDAVFLLIKVPAPPLKGRDATENREWEKDRWWQASASR